MATAYVQSPRPLTAQPLCSGRGDLHLSRGESKDGWDYQNWGGLQRNDLHVGVPGRTPRVLLAPMPRAWLVCWALAQGCWASVHGSFRVYGVKGLYLYLKTWKQDLSLH